MNHFGRGRNHLLEFLLFPVSFFLLGYFLIFLMLLPFWGFLSSSADLIFFQTPYQTEQPAENIFTSAPATVSETVKLSDIRFPEYGDLFGRLTISSASVQADLYFGDGSEQLKKGVGIYNGSAIPGYGRTVLIAGHNHTFFHTLGNVQVGDKVEIETNYGHYVYKITGTQVKNASDQSAYDLSMEKDNLVLYTCYPFNELGLTPNRFYVYADYVSGPKINKQE